MRIVRLRVAGFRGMHDTCLHFSSHQALIGKNGVGKSTVVDALSLLLGRTRLVRDLTEHDFLGSDPGPTSRIFLSAVLVGFPKDDPEKSPQWFRAGRAVERYWDREELVTYGSKGPDRELCAEIGLCARFDRETLSVEQIRFFVDDEESDLFDPFSDDTVERFPTSLLSEVGYFVLPADRTWTGALSFASELFKKAVAATGGVPSSAVLAQRDLARAPEAPMEEDAPFKPLVDRLNLRLGQLLPGDPKLRLRLTATDSDAILRALVPHFEVSGSHPLPVGRHGKGLASLQSFLLLLEIGRARKEKGQSFILALEEPELHVPPGLQRRLLGDAARATTQLLCTTHAPRLASFFYPHEIQILQHDKAVQSTTGRKLVPEPMVADRNALVQLFTESRVPLIEALLQPCVLLPEGRVDYEWFRILLDVHETSGDLARESKVPPFSSLIGVVPTRDAAVIDTFERLDEFHCSVIVLLDGDSAGDSYAKTLSARSTPPFAQVRWPKDWEIEDVVGWVIDASSGQVLTEINRRLDRSFRNVPELVTSLKSKNGKEGGLKTHYIAHEEIAGAIRQSDECVSRTRSLLEAFAAVAIGEADSSSHISTDHTNTHTFVP